MGDTFWLVTRAPDILCIHTIGNRLSQQHTCRGVLYENTNRYTEAEQDYR